ncbi:MAG: alanine--tRNA ligase [Rikenellaceae bacterium]|nr:alanine--tRNA ligase [Rikenellaceae bacterium]MCL2691860.1 alanine--tRNA ligase [Rikenellaceae bacterium]
MTANRIREAFLEFFRSKGHAIVPSAPMVIKNDPTLMFTNAGMNQFKDIFLGNSPVTAPRVADTQKCLRVSGKHNDLEEVGRDTYHHTMFEMLGNWSFGDYFKKEAIEWAWEFLVGVLGLPADRIYATVFEGSAQDGVARDEEAYGYWRQFLPAEQILLGNKKDNFWEMGDTGPCGPCSEVHFDLRSDEERAGVAGSELVNRDHPHVVEIWNLVFMQFNRRADGSLAPLPMNHVDTGMGFERLCMIMQQVQSNYDTDVFRPIIAQIAQMAGRVYGADEQTDIAIRVVADHLRAIAFSIADGQLPSNVKAGYVIRRILRRAVRYGYTYLGFSEPFIWRLVDVLAGQMGAQFPELEAQKELIKKVVREEEASFLHTLATGIALLDSVMGKARGEGRTTISGAEAFTLYDTFGFPIDLTALIAREGGMEVDMAGFDTELAHQKERSRAAAAVETGDWTAVTDSASESVFVGYDTLIANVRIVRYRRVETKGKTFWQVVFDRTPFYGNSGGQLGDAGYIETPDGTRLQVTDTQKENALTTHIMPELPQDVSAIFTAVVNAAKRTATAANHTATHLLHEALREVLGGHVEQKGSLVGADGLRFDFAHFQKVTAKQLREVERSVNRRVRLNYPLEEERECPIELAQEMGAVMLFGEKYGSTVRVVRFGSAVELCGGTHVTATGDIGLLRITSESAIAAGVRRIEAVTGEAAERSVHALEDLIEEIKDFLNNPSIMQALKKMLEENEELRSQMEEYRQEKKELVIDRIVSEAREEDGIVLFARHIDLPADMVKNIAFALRQRIPNVVMIVGSNHADRTTLSVLLGDELAANGLNASEIVREAAREIGGSGGGQPFFATAGGKNPQGLEKAITAAVGLVKGKLK